MTKWKQFIINKVIQCESIFIRIKGEILKKESKKVKWIIIALNGGVMINQSSNHIQAIMMEEEGTLR